MAITIIIIITIIKAPCPAAIHHLVICSCVIVASVVLVLADVISVRIAISVITV